MQTDNLLPITSVTLVTSEESNHSNTSKYSNNNNNSLFSGGFLEGKTEQIKSAVLLFERGFVGVHDDRTSRVLIFPSQEIGEIHVLQASIDRLEKKSVEASEARHGPG